MDTPSDLYLAELAQRAYDSPNINEGYSSAVFKEESEFCAIAIAGTNDFVDVMVDLWAIPWKPKRLNAWVHRGFWKHLYPLLDPLLEGIRYTSTKPVYLTGHSLGGAAANIFAAICYQEDIDIRGLTTFGSPRVGYKSLTELTKSIPGKRFVIDGDQVTQVPPSWFAFPYMHDRSAFLFPDNDKNKVLEHPMAGYLDMIKLL